ncbi:hypothetical protein ACHAWO_013158 [Cyclotella atomus]|uniref:C2HC zinc finger plants domain-containing protein n=1 Tax=Cyclotella atomus TaxID=382360 RepID=A0ABD3MZQ3_9STRA
MEHPLGGQRDRQRQGHEPPPSPSTTPNRRGSYICSHSNGSDLDEHMDVSYHQSHSMQQTLQQQQSQQIAQLLQYANSSYNSNPTDALSALMDALTLQSGPNAAQLAMKRIRTELGETVANCVAQHQTCAEREMTLRAMAVVEEMMNDTSTFLYAQGRQHILQQAMKDGSSVICSNCGDMVKASRWTQHSTMWCRAIDDMDDSKMDC